MNRAMNSDMNSAMNSDMIKDYIAEALSHAQYEVIEDEEPYYGEVPGLAGVYATGRSLEECRENLKNVIEGWILARIEHNLDVPSICPATDGNGLHGGGVDQK